MKLVAILCAVLVAWGTSGLATMILDGGSFERLSGPEGDFARQVGAYRGSIIPFQNRKSVVEGALDAYREKTGMSRDEVLSLAERTLAELLLKRDVAENVDEDIAWIQWCIAYSGHMRASDVLEAAAFAEWNSARWKATLALVEMSPEAALQLVRRTIRDGAVLDSLTRAGVYRNAAELWLMEPKAEVDAKTRQAMVESLREAATKTDDYETAWSLEKVLVKCDPSWRGSAEREALAKRFLATYVPEGKEKRWPELAVKEDAQMTEEGRTNIHNFFSAALADVETARKEAAEKEAKSAEAVQP